MRLDVQIPWVLLQLLSTRRSPIPRVRSEPIIDTRRNPPAFFDHVKAIDRRQGDMLHSTTGPMDFDSLHRRAFPQTKVNPLIVRGGETSPAKYVRPLAHAPSGEIDGSSYSIPRTLRTADEPKAHP